MENTIITDTTESFDDSLDQRKVLQVSSDAYQGPITYELGIIVSNFNGVLWYDAGTFTFQITCSYVEEFAMSSAIPDFVFEFGVHSGDDILG